MDDQSLPLISTARRVITTHCGSRAIADSIKASGPGVGNVLVAVEVAAGDMPVASSDIY